MTDAERDAWAKSLIAACRAKGLHAIAVTDHHDTVLIPYARKAAEEEIDAAGDPIPEDQRVVVFPGMELTLSEPCQALLLFDASLPLEHLSLLPAALGYEVSAASDSKTAQTTPLSLSINEVIERLAAQSVLKGRFIVLPNVTDGGHKTLLRSGFAQKYREMACVGGYVDGSFENKTGEGNRRILNGDNRDYGNKALAVFQTSDCRNANFDALGRHSTWVKWSVPTAEALRQSCLARQTRVLLEKPALPRSHLTRIEVSASRFLGKVNLFLNPQLNALIGGRGTGKSTLLEYARWALCDRFAISDPGQEVPDFEKRHQSLVERTLAGVEGVVSVHVVVNGVAHVVRRRSGKSAEVTVKVGSSAFRVADEDEVRRLVPVDAYSQKELSSLGGRAADMRQFLASAIEAKLDGAATEIRNASDRIRAAYARLQNARSLRAEERTLASEVESLTQQIDKVRETVTDVAESDARLLAAEDLYQEEARVFGQWRAELESTLGNLRTLAQSLDGNPEEPLRLEQFPDRALFEKMFEDLKAQYGELLNEANRWIAALTFAIEGDEAQDDRFASYHEAATTYEATIEKTRAAYEAVKERMSSQAAALTQLEELRSRLKERQATLSERKRQLDELAPVDREFQNATSDWTQAIRSRAAHLIGQAEWLEQASSGLIRAVVAPTAGFDQVAARLTEAVRGSRLRGDRIDAIFEGVRDSDDPLASWLHVLDELESLLVLSKDESVKLPHLPMLRAAGFTDRDLHAVASQLSTDLWVGLRTIPPDDVVRFQYRSREADYIPFEDASAGQRATALIRVLLTQEGPPLIIDQPEDDLDNEVIHTVARDLWSAKSRRQLIFASHNANLVVNGDADLVAVFGYVVTGEQSSGEVKTQGAIDDEAVRTAITRIMEGGQEAFELRHAKYGF